MRGLYQLCCAVAGSSTNQSYRNWGKGVGLGGCDLPSSLNPLHTKLNPICHMLALLGAHHILHISRIRVKPPNISDSLYSCIHCSGHWYQFVTLKTEATTGRQLLAESVRREKGSCHSTRLRDGLTGTMAQGWHRKWLHCCTLASGQDLGRSAAR
jgi:hypothetical protein